MQKRTFLTGTTPESIDAPVQIIGLIVINATDRDCVVTADNGDTFPCPALVISTWSLPPTLRISAQLVGTPTNGEACNVIVTDEPTLNSTSQLSTLSSTISVITPSTTLPATPEDGQQAILVDSTAAPSWAWLMQYSLAAGEWIFIGGSPASSEIVNTEGTSSTSYADLATVGPSFQVPYAGVYEIEYGAWGIGKSSGVWGSDWVTPKVGAAAASDDDSIQGAGTTSGNTQISSSRKIRKTAGKNDVIKLQYRISGSPGPAQFARRFIKVTPVTITP